eukprot:SAG31_NODE_2027_length_6639_cov_10.777676_4_plen_80_part_00
MVVDADDCATAKGVDSVTICGTQVRNSNEAVLHVASERKILGPFISCCSLRLALGLYGCDGFQTACISFARRVVTGGQM